MELITNILLTVLILMFATFGVLAWLFISKLKATITNFVLPVSPGQPSPLANSVDAISVMIARAITAQVKTTLMGMQSGATRAETAIKGDMVQDLANASPLGGLLGSFPALGKTLKRNPGLLDLALNFMMSRQPGKSGVAAGSNGNGQVKFNL
jgi:hypothetical protein